VKSIDSRRKRSGDRATRRAAVRDFDHEDAVQASGELELAAGSMSAAAVLVVSEDTVLQHSN
jgi:hypothetical protein